MNEVAELLFDEREVAECGAESTRLELQGVFDQVGSLTQLYYVDFFQQMKAKKCLDRN